MQVKIFFRKIFLWKNLRRSTLDKLVKIHYTIINQGNGLSFYIQKNELKREPTYYESGYQNRNVNACAQDGAVKYQTHGRALQSFVRFKECRTRNYPCFIGCNRNGSREAWVVGKAEKYSHKTSCRGCGAM